jgi:hypothetical protein
MRRLRWRTPIARDIRLTVFFSGGSKWPPLPGFAEIDRSIAIVVEAAQNLNRANFPLKSKAKKFDGLAVGFGPSEEIFCAYKSARYDAPRGSSGSEGVAAFEKLSM